MKKTIIKGLTVLGAALTFAAFGQNTTVKADSSVTAIKKRGTVRIATFGDLPPYGWVNKDGKRVGYDVALGRKIAKDLGVKAKFILTGQDPIQK